MKAIESFHMKCQRRILGIRWHDFVRNSEVSLRTGLAPVSDRITRCRNAIFGHVARLPDSTPAHQAKSNYRSVDPQTLHGNVHQVDHVPNGPTNSAAITTMFPLRLCGDGPLPPKYTSQHPSPTTPVTGRSTDSVDSLVSKWSAKVKVKVNRV